jgi:hypothetical protein
MARCSSGWLARIHAQSAVSPKLAEMDESAWSMVPGRKWGCALCRERNRTNLRAEKERAHRQLPDLRGAAFAEFEIRKLHVDIPDLRAPENAATSQLFLQCSASAFRLSSQTGSE